MKNEEAQMATTITSSNATILKKESAGSDNGLFGKGKYKLWALAAIILLALWSMFTGSVTLNWSAGNLTSISDELDFHQDFDILEVEDREKKVRQMWNLYTHSNSLRLPSFWQLAFKAAYEDLASEDQATRDAAVSEIARMSLHSSNSNDLGFEAPHVARASTNSPQINGKKDEKSSKLGKSRRRLQ
ncbi:hypothetical protein Leryth_003648 [Lithospermum erythrorhizon]|uniref:Sugar transporter n=1 Tax=Lithospermum erythrorhizon TaxID=34254 RepID=A0AAV3QZI3_LITER|nr:hypothetical protein Leryth_003648 [Lithospermum erythrorhizon]